MAGGSASQSGRRGKKSSRADATAEAEKVLVAKAIGRTEVLLAATPWIGGALLVAVAWFPLQALQPIVEELAGKETNVSASFSISLMANLLIGGAYFVERGKNKRQKAELQRLRGRLEAKDAPVAARSGKGSK